MRPVGVERRAVTSSIETTGVSFVSTASPKPLASDCTAGGAVGEDPGWSREFRAELGCGSPERLPRAARGLATILLTLNDVR